MPENNITFNRTNGLGRQDPSQDHVSGILFYTDTFPSGFDANNRVKPIFSLQEAVDLGIVSTHADETPATSGAALLTTPGAAGDISSITFDGVVLGTYTVVLADAVADVASGLVDAINALTIKTGFSATLSTATVLITPPAKMGIVPNSATLALATDGTTAATMTQFSAGVGSVFAQYNYHISEFFRKNPTGKLWVGIYAEATFDGAEIALMRAAADGEIRQIAVYLPDETFATSMLSSTQTQLALARTEKENMFGILHADMSSLTASTLPNLAALTSSKVALCAGEDGNFLQQAYSATKSYVAGDKCKWLNKTYITSQSSVGQAPYDTEYFTEVSLNLPDIVGNSVSTLGNLLGCYSSAKVNESICNPERFPLSSGNILSVAGFATGVLYKDISQSLRNQLNDYHYTYLRVFSGSSEVYYNDSYTCIARSDDYATGENNRTMDKAERKIYIALVPKIAGDITLNEDGTMEQQSINEYHSIVDGELEVMRIDGEISQKEVTINQTQNILQTSTLAITFEAIPKGKARNIVVNNSYAVKLG